MATQLTVGSTSRAGLAVSPTAADAGGNWWVNTGAEVLYIVNGGGSPITLTLTFSANAKIDGQSPANRTVTVTNGTTQIVGPFPTTYYNDSNNPGRMNVTYSAVTSVTVQVFSVGS